MSTEGRLTAWLAVEEYQRPARRDRHPIPRSTEVAGFARVRPDAVCFDVNGYGRDTHWWDERGRVERCHWCGQERGVLVLHRERRSA